MKNLPQPQPIPWRPSSNSVVLAMNFVQSFAPPVVPSHAPLFLLLHRDADTPAARALSSMKICKIVNITSFTFHFAIETRNYYLFR
jgi:hypothetical protein